MDFEVAANRRKVLLGVPTLAGAATLGSVLPVEFAPSSASAQNASAPTSKPANIQEQMLYQRAYEIAILGDADPQLAAVARGTPEAWREGGRPRLSGLASDRKDRAADLQQHHPLRSSPRPKVDPPEIPANG